MIDEPTPQAPGRRVALAILWLGAVAAITGAVAIGWFMHAWLDGGDDISIDRPVNVVQSEPIVSGYVPNVLGLSKQSALQAMVDSGVKPSAISTEIMPHIGDLGLVVDQSPGPGSKLKNSKVTLALSGPATMPDLTGDTLDSARTRLTKMGAKISTTYRFNQGARENQVLTTTPGVGQPLKSSVELVVAEPSTSVFLADVEPLTNDCNGEAAILDGNELEHSLVCTPDAGQPATAIYRLNRKIESFAATVGLADDGDDSAPVRLVIHRDRELVANFTVRFGQAREIKISVASALRLTLEVRGGGGSSDVLDSKAVLGNARLIGGSSAIDAISADDTQP
ncbi:MAG: PASTA domain-containing protein [Solirubrobacterales bacterium]